MRRYGVHWCWQALVIALHSKAPLRQPGRSAGAGYLVDYAAALLKRVLVLN